MTLQKISKKQLREFGLLIGFFFPLLIGFVIPKLSGHDFRIWSLWIGILGVVLGLTFPNSLYYPYRLWMLFGMILGWFNSKLILGLIFIFVLQPVAFIMRIFGYDPLKIRTNSSKSYREIRKKHKIDLTSIF